MTVPFSTARNIQQTYDETITNNAAGGANVVQLSDGATNFITSFASLSVDAGTGDLVCGSGFSANTRNVEVVAGDCNALSGKMEAMTTIPTQPIAFDNPNYAADVNGDFKMKLQLGHNLASVPVAPFDAQNPLSAAILGFPAGQVLDYVNNLPLRDTRIIGRIASGVVIAPGANYRIQNFGNSSAGFDRLVYDPANMRSRQIGTGWYYAGCPNLYRVAGLKGCMTAHVYFDGLWQGAADPANKIVFYVHQYRNAALLRSFVLGCDRSQDGECIVTGRRTFLGHSGGFGEDFDPITDDFDCEFINQSPVVGNSIQLNVGQVEYEFSVSA